MTSGKQKKKEMGESTAPVSRPSDWQPESDLAAQSEKNQGSRAVKFAIVCAARNKRVGRARAERERERDQKMSGKI